MLCWFMVLIVIVFRVIDMQPECLGNRKEVVQVTLAS